MDVDDDESVADGIGTVLSEHGRIDAVITAAGWGLAGPVETTPIEQAKAQLETNFWGTVRVVREVLPVMRGQGRGRVVLVGSLGGLVGLPFQAYYSASKYALEGFAEALAYEVSPFGIAVTLLEPGNAATDFTAQRRRHDPADADSPYAGPNASAVATMEQDERNGMPAVQVAAAVERILAAGNPPRRVPVGKAMSDSVSSPSGSCRTGSSSVWPGVRWGCEASAGGTSRSSASRVVRTRHRPADEGPPSG